MSSPNPGSPEAIDAGCTCPVIDNAHGAGYMGIAGVYCYREGCPLHWEELLEMSKYKEKQSNDKPIPTMTDKEVTP